MDDATTFAEGHGGGGGGSDLPWGRKEDEDDCVGNALYAHGSPNDETIRFDV